LEAPAESTPLSPLARLSRSCRRIFNILPSENRCASQNAYDETPALRRQTLAPKQDFVVLPLTPESVRPILDVVLPDNRYIDDIIHIQIEKANQLQFGSYDQFDDRCIVGFPPGVTAELLDELQSSGVIHSWSVPHEGAQRWHG
jgi:hypothetical protein